MIKINFSSAISIYLCFSIILVFIAWVFYNYRKDGISSETKDLQQCPYCTYIFFNHAPRKSLEKPYNAGDQSQIADEIEGKSRVLACPRCHSYINLGNQSKEEGK